MNDKFFMSLAYKEALKAKRNNEIPVGAVVVKEGQIISQAYNQKEQNQKVAAHAEMLAIEMANSKLKSWRLEGCHIYVTLEPCLMCAGAIGSARFEKLIYACKDPKIGAGNFLNHPNWNHKVEVLSGVMEASCSQLLENFFKKLR